MDTRYGGRAVAPNQGPRVNKISVRYSIVPLPDTMSSNVGKISMTWAGACSHEPPRLLIPSGQCAIKGVAIPPSHTLALCPLKGALATVAHPCPSLHFDSGSVGSSPVRSPCIPPSLLPPLSERNRMRVDSNLPRAFNPATKSPTALSNLWDCGVDAHQVIIAVDGGESGSHAVNSGGRSKSTACVGRRIVCVGY